MTKSTIVMALICILGMASCHAQTHQPAPPTTEGEAATVYMTTDISPEGLVRIYEALGVEAHGRVAVKNSTGESEKSNCPSRTPSTYNMISSARICRTTTS